jgi:hypothetical protein
LPYLFLEYGDLEAADLIGRFLLSLSAVASLLGLIAACLV